MITESRGDLLKANTTAIVNTVNCVGVMGKGIALQFKRRYPTMFAAYEQACKKGDVAIGRMLVYPTGELDGAEYVINFPTKVHWRSPSKIEYIDAGLADLVRVVEELRIDSIAIPPLGAGNGGLAWQDVEPRIVSAFTHLPNVTAVIYPPTQASRTLDAPQRLRVTWGRAVLLELVRRYAAQRRELEPWEDASGTSPLEIQKLMYFADRLEPGLKLAFAPGRYGPYSERVRHVLQAMEGGYTTGFGDGTAKVLDYKPVELTSRGVAELDVYLASPDAPRVKSIVDAVLQSVEGFEGPYGLELLASTHWVARMEAACDPITAATAVRSWTRRKGRIYTEYHVSVALRHLQEQQHAHPELTVPVL